MTHADTPAFTPVPVRPRHDGWTPQRQALFLETLADTGCVSHAAARVGLSVESAYRLRRRKNAASFAAAWEGALAHGTQRLVDLAFERAIDGVAVPVFYKGEVVGERRTYSDKLLMFALRHHDPLRYGALARLTPFQPDDPRVRAASLFDRLLARLFRRAHGRGAAKGQASDA